MAIYWALIADGATWDPKDVRLVSGRLRDAPSRSSPKAAPDHCAREGHVDGAVGRCHQHPLRGQLDADLGGRLPSFLLTACEETSTRDSTMLGITPKVLNRGPYADGACAHMVAWLHLRVYLSILNPNRHAH